MEIPLSPIGIIFITSVYAIFVTYLWGLASVTFSPFAAGICMWLARRRGLNVWYYGLTGAIYSVFFLYPWVYLAMRLLGRRMSPIIVIAGYVNLYLWWLASLYIMFFGGTIVRYSYFHVHVFIGAIAAVGSALALIVHNLNHREELAQNVEPFLGGDTSRSRALVAGYAVFCVLWFVLLFAVYGVGYGFYIQLHYISLLILLIIAIPAIFAVGSAWALIRNRNRREKLEQNVKPFIGGYTPSSSDLIRIAPFALAFISVSATFGVCNLRI